jgi:glutamine synthetase
MTPPAVVEQAQRANVTLVRFLYCGSDGLIRGKAIHSTHLERRLTEGVSLPLALHALTSLDQPGPYGAVGEVRLLPDPATFAELPYTPRQARLFCDLAQSDYQPLASCPRSFLKRMLARLARHGMQIQAAFETEFYLLRQVDGQYVPADAARAYSTIGMDTAAAVILEVIDALAAQGILVEQYHPEYGPGQHEISIAPAWGVQAADNQLTVRDTLRGVASRHGLVASLAPSPLIGQAGNGCHIHFSLWDETHTRNLLYDPQAAGHLSPVGAHFVAGLLAHLPALAALTAPSVNSYRRLRPGLWSGAYACYGPDNREAAVRLCSPFRQREMASANLELRTCDASCNPYLALGGVLAAGMDGLLSARHPGMPVTHNPVALADEACSLQGIARLPQALEAALAALQQDAVLMDALGGDLAQVYLAVKRAEATAFREQDPERERSHVLCVY